MRKFIVLILLSQLYSCLSESGNGLDYISYLTDNSIPLFYSNVEAVKYAKENDKHILIVFDSYMSKRRSSALISDLIKNLQVVNKLKKKYIVVILYLDDRIDKGSRGKENQRIKRMTTGSGDINEFVAMDSGGVVLTSPFLYSSGTSEDLINWLP